MKSISINNLDNSSLEETVNQIKIPACLSKKDNLQKIFFLIKKNPKIKKIYICDDYLDPNDKETKYFCERIKEDLPAIEIKWTRELKVDGRHGR